MTDTSFPSFFAEPGGGGGHTLRDDATWGLIRHDYLAGASGPLLAERYGVSESALRTRARKEGWRKADQPDPDWRADDDDAEPYDPSAPPVAAAELAAHARWETARAVRARRPAEAERWTRVHDRWAAVARAEAAEADKALRDAETRRREEDGAVLKALALEARRGESEARACNTQINLELKQRLATVAARMSAAVDLQPLQPLQPDSDPATRLAELDAQITDRKRRGLPAGKLIGERDALRRGIGKLE